jgi:bis(5'-nucleosyl)-tetraphosphatase (symmetrical)
LATYAIGDLQGCCASLDELLDKLKLDWSTDSLWFAGDLVNRGPDSLGTLREIKALQESHPGQVITVLGNHDLYLLAVYFGAVRAKTVDTFTDVLAATDHKELLDWMRHQPLLHRQRIADEEFVLVHAGLLPQWSAEQAEQLAFEHYVRQTGPDHAQWFHAMFGAQPNQWSNALVGDDRLRVIVNAMTRLRVCNDAGEMEFSAKGDPKRAPAGFKPWFDVPRQSSDATVVFGHWSALGLTLRPNLICLDSGCVWGRSLTAVRLEDRQVTAVDCPQYSELTD